MIVGASGLLRGGLVAVLSAENDIQVVAEVASANGRPVALSEPPDVVLIDVDVFDTDAPTMVRRFTADFPGCSVIILTWQGTASALREALAADARGYISKDHAPAELIEMVRQVYAGDRVIDPVTALAALRTATNPLSAREREVLRAVSEGLSAKEIAERLFLTHGTVRNHLSAILRKTGTRTRLDALRLAQEAGWI